MLASCSSGLLGAFGSKPDPDAQVPIVGFGGGNWYLIVERNVDGDVKYQPFKANQAPPNDHPHTVPFDTASWFAKLGGKGVTPQTEDFEIDGFGSLEVRNGYLSDVSVGAMQNAVARTKWTEIGIK